MYCDDQLYYHILLIRLLKLSKENTCHEYTSRYYYYCIIETSSPWCHQKHGFLKDSKSWSIRHNSSARIYQIYPYNYFTSSYNYGLSVITGTITIHYVVIDEVCTFNKQIYHRNRSTCSIRSVDITGWFSKFQFS